MSNISIILPVHELNEETKTLFINAMTSVKTQLVQPDELIVVVPKDSDVEKYVKSLDLSEYNNIVIASNDGKTDFASQVNFGVELSKSEWFSVLEFDDEYANIWLKNVVTYRDAYPNVELFMPIIVDVDSTNAFIGFSNQPVWANGFCDELGMLDNNALLAYQGFNIDGMVIKKSIYEEFGGFKPSIKLTFTYEFLLRMTFKDVKVMIIPKLGYKHLNGRKDSLFLSYKETLDPVEAKWWLSIAKREYYFKKDREIKYEQPSI